MAVGTDQSPEMQDIVIPIDTAMWNTISLLESFKVRYPVPQFIKDTFFAGRTYASSDVVQIDVKRGSRKLAPFVLPMEGQVVERRRPFIRTFVEAPTLAPARVITLREANRPGWGENSFNYLLPEARVAQMYADDTEEMDDEIARTEEKMCCDCMFSGRVHINYRNKTDQVIDFGFTNVTAVSKAWTDPTALPLNDLQATQAGLNGFGYSGNVAIYSPQAWAALWGNPQVQNLMKNLSGLTPISGYTLPQALPAGVQRAPSFTYPVMENYIYAGTYTKNGVVTQLVPNGGVLIGSSNVKNRLVYGIVTQIEQADGQWHQYMSDRVPKVECNVNKNFYMYTLTARPVPIPLDLLSWTVLTGVAT